MEAFDLMTVIAIAATLVSAVLVAINVWTLRKSRAIARDLQTYIADTQWRRAMEQDLTSFFKKEAFRQGFRDGLEHSRPS